MGWLGNADFKATFFSSFFYNFCLLLGTYQLLGTMSICSICTAWMNLQRACRITELPMQLAPFFQESNILC